MDATTSASFISTREVLSALQGGQPPLIIDVRREQAFRAATDMIAGALWRDPERVALWAGELPRASRVVAYCVHGHEVSQGVAKALGEHGIAAKVLKGGIEEGWKAAGGALDRKAAGANTRWVTRERPKIDRIACPWLVARFVDPGAEFLYVPAKEVLAAAEERDATPYDIPDVHFSHEGERCSFDAFLKHYPDTARLDLAPQAPGLAAISLGLSRNFADDHEMLKAGMVMYDALYAWCKAGQEEIHTWNPAAYR